jgi:hypothetical protein
MRVYNRYWLDYDAVTFALLMIGLSIIEVLVLGI